ncbi:MAG: hypothetical protein IJ706_09520 [Clostridia bacterium]|nr:hypothetical protein [Clostridia bacterium]
MKQIYRVISIVVSAALSFAAFCACRGNDGESSGDVAKNVDQTKSQLTVANAYGGLGDQWLRAVIAQFEDFYKDEVFEDGKKGVQVQVENKLVNDMSGQTMLAKVQGAKEAIWIGEGVYYYDFANSGYCADITELVSTPLTEFGENKSIVDKLDDYLTDELKTDDGKYYLMPFYEGFYQTYYDADLFDENMIYFKDGASADGQDVFDEEFDYESLFISSPNDKKSAGPDKEYGTIDDGLPVSYADFFAMSRYLYYSCGIVPMVWTGAYITYLIRYCVSLWANQEGYKNASAYLQLAGELDDLINVDASGNVTSADSVTLNESNGYYFQKQKSKYDVLKFVKNLVSHSFIYDSMSYSSSLSHLGAQDRFLYSKTLSNVQTIATLTEGSWWYNEATSTFNAMEADSGDRYGRQNRRIGVLPPLHATASDNDGSSVLFSLNDSYCFINDSVTGVTRELAEKFFRFLHTDKALSTFTKVTGMTRAFEYKIEGSEFDEMMFYAKSMYSLKKNSKVIYPVSKNSKVINNPNYFDPAVIHFTTQISGDTYSNPFRVFKDNPGITPESYFNGLYTYAHMKWGSLK